VSPKRNAADAAIPWTGTPGVTSPTGSDLTLVAVTGQTTIVGEAGEAVTIAGTAAFSGKITCGSFGSPTDVTAVREYGVELHFSGDDYNVTALRSRASLVTTDTTAGAQGALLQAANNDGIDAGVLNGALIEAIGKSSGTAATITTMRGCLVNTEWDANDTVTNLRTLHVRSHTRNSAVAGYVSGTGYLVYIENEAVGGNGQQLDAGIYLKATNVSTPYAFDYGIDLSGATGEVATADIKLSSGGLIGGPSGHLTIASGGDITLADETDIILNTTTGSKLGTAAGQKLGFYGSAPVVQQAHIIDADGTLADITTKFNTLLSQLETYGLLAAA